MLTIESPVDFDYDPYSEEALRDPTDLYRELRNRYPAYPLPQYNAWALSRFEDVRVATCSSVHGLCKVGGGDPEHHPRAEGVAVLVGLGVVLRDGPAVDVDHLANVEDRLADVVGPELDIAG